MQKFGIDISLYQKGMNLDRAIAEGVEFAILRGGVHLGKDSCFDDFYKQCKARNIPVGVYLYSYATTVEAAEQEAAFLIEKVLKGKQFEYPVYMDVETKNQQKAGKAVMTKVVTAFCEKIKAAGYLPGIYASLGFYKSYLDDSQLPYEKWVAQWAKKCQYTGDLGMWQFGGETNYIRTNKIAGKVCDQDYCYKDYPAMVKAQGLNGYGAEEAPEVKEEPKPVKPAPVKTVKATSAARYILEPLAGTYTVIASALNVRHGAGVLKKKMVTIPRGTKVNCYGYYSTSLGAKWLCVQFDYQSVTYTGFCHSKYLIKEK